jgi:mRNA interferase MazF
VVTPAYVPHSGDLVWLDFDPQIGREQAGRRPALILSPRPYNELTDLCLACPITSRIKGYPFEVNVKGKKIEGVILADHLKNLDWKKRNATLIERATEDVVLDVVAKLTTLLPMR